MIFNYIKSNQNICEEEFDEVYPHLLQSISPVHFSPISVSKSASEYLVDKKGCRVLDIGAGVGKFCMIGATCTEGYFVGVEQRKDLCVLAQEVIERYHLKNIEIINDNIVNIDFKQFDAFYFFNSFQENISIADKIDNTCKLSRELYVEYSMYVREQLELMPIGTKLVTYYSFLKEVPVSYTLQATKFGNDLKMWKKSY
ncbi:MAG: methyltransferase domain-containing protein [Saprospiraceae bacterium]|nr:methyltransferase domain-containing protein [Saprospiraceae bacterium]